MNCDGRKGGRKMQNLQSILIISAAPILPITFYLKAIKTLVVNM